MFVSVDITGVVVGLKVYEDGGGSVRAGEGAVSPGGELGGQVEFWGTHDIIGEGRGGCEGRVGGENKVGLGVGEGRGELSEVIFVELHKLLEGGKFCLSSV